MDIIDNFDKLTLGQYIEIQALFANESLDDVDRQVQVLSILTGVSEEEIYHLPIPEYKGLVARSAFLAPENMTSHPIARRYLVGGFELVPVTDFRKLETGQYIDFHTYAPDLDKNMVEFLSVILVPKGHRYNEGYDILEVQKAIREEMSVADGVSLVAFFLTSCETSIADSLNYCRREAKKVKDKAKRAKLMRRIEEQEMLLRGNGDGSPM